MMTLKLSPSLRQNVLAPGAKQIAINRRTTKRGNCCAGGTLSGGQVTGGRSPPAGVTVEQGVQGDAVLLPGSGVSPAHFPPPLSPPQAGCIGSFCTRYTPP